MMQDRKYSATALKPEIMAGRKLSGTEAIPFSGFHNDPDT
jgi:hypothetical protein